MTHGLRPARTGARAAADARRPRARRRSRRSRSRSCLVFYLVEAWTRKTPWIFTDELEWTQISRSIASTGHAARRGQPLYFKSLYAYVIAPFWWIHSTSTAYAAIKYANALIMSLAAIPTYLLARMLVSRRTAVVVAVASVAVPAMAYVTSIVPEVLAYPYFALCSWLAVRALRSGRRLDVAIALVFLARRLLRPPARVHDAPVAFVDRGGRPLVHRPPRPGDAAELDAGDTIGCVRARIGALFLFNRVVLQHVHEWQVTTQYYKNRMVDLGLDAGLSLAIGLGILPVIGGLVSLRLPERRGDPDLPRLRRLDGGSDRRPRRLHGRQGRLHSRPLRHLWEERTLIFLSPLLLLGTAMVLQAKRLDWRVVAGATALRRRDGRCSRRSSSAGPTTRHPGSAIPAALATTRHWTEHDVRIGLIVILALSLGPARAAAQALGRAAHGRLAARVDARRRDHDDRRDRHGRRPVPREPARRS